MAFYQLFSSLQNGDIDIIISALSSTPNRESDMDFSIPYYTSSISMLSLAYNNFNGTLTPNLKVGVEKGTIMENWIQNQNKSLNLEISSSISVMNILNDLINKNIDVMLIESAVAANIMNTANIQFKEFKVPNTDTNSFVIAVKKGNPIISQINTILETMQQDNSLNTLKQKWDLQ
jgi:polar amino acid transport system substrate-binding protein